MFPEGLHCARHGGESGETPQVSDLVNTQISLQDALKPALVLISQAIISRFTCFEGRVALVFAKQGLAPIEKDLNPGPSTHAFTSATRALQVLHQMLPPCKCNLEWGKPSLNYLAAHLRFIG